MSVYGWLSTSQSNENGCSNGGFNHDINKWEAFVYPQGKREKCEYFASISWRKVNKWLEQKRKQYDLR